MPHRIRSHLALVLLLTTLSAAASVEISSPNAGVKLTISNDAEGHLVYSVMAHGQPRLETARAGIIVDDRDLGASGKLGLPAQSTVSETFPWRGNKTLATNRCQVALIPVSSGTPGLEWTLEARVFNDGAAFRYRVPGSGTRRIRGDWSLDIFRWTRNFGSGKTWRQWNRSASRAVGSRAMMWRWCGR